jgi:hypothetical protein
MKYDFMTSNWHVFSFMIFLPIPYYTMVIDDVTFLVYLVATVTTSVSVV